MTQYNRGASFERELIKLLTDNGYSCIRGAGSKGFFLGDKVDVVATKSTSYQDKTAYILWAQLKVSKKRG